MKPRTYNKGLSDQTKNPSSLNNIGTEFVFTLKSDGGGEETPKEVKAN